MSAVIARGKTKTIYDVGNERVHVCSRNAMTAGDGARRTVLKGKAIASTATTSNVFRLLERHGIRTHYLAPVDRRTFLARRVRMLALELVVRRIATGSYVRRNPEVEDGTRFEELVFELFEKDDANNDPLLEFDFRNGQLRRWNPKKQRGEEGALLSEESLGDSRFSEVTYDLFTRLYGIATGTFLVLERAWAEQDGVLFDFKIEVGFDRQGLLVVADVIDSDSWRLRVHGDEKSKENFRRGDKSLAAIRLDFEEVARVTERFVQV